MDAYYFLIRKKGTILTLIWPYSYSPGLPYSVSQCWLRVPVMVLVYPFLLLRGSYVFHTIMGLSHCVCFLATEEFERDMFLIRNERNGFF